MAGPPAQSLKDKSSSPIARSDPKRGDRELASDEIVLSGCYTKKDHGLKRARQDSEQRLDEKRVEKEVNSPEYSLTTCTSHSLTIHSPARLKHWLPRPEYWPYSPEHTTYDYILPGTDPNIRYDARDGVFALRTSFMAFTRCQYQEEKKFKRARRDSEQSVDEKGVEQELNSLEYSPTTCTSPPSPEYWPCSPESWPYSSKHSPTTPPYVPEYWPCSPMSPNHCQEVQDYTPTSTGPNIRARQDSEQRIDEKRAEEELKSPEYSPTSSLEYSPTSPTSYGLHSPGNWPESPTTPLYTPNWLPNSP